MVWYDMRSCLWRRKGFGQEVEELFVNALVQVDEAEGQECDSAADGD
jgi:hypothetical protein